MYMYMYNCLDVQLCVSICMRVQYIEACFYNNMTCLISLGHIFLLMKEVQFVGWVQITMNYVMCTIHVAW